MAFGFGCYTECYTTSAPSKSIGGIRFEFESGSINLSSSLIAFRATVSNSFVTSVNIF